MVGGAHTQCGRHNTHGGGAAGKGEDSEAACVLSELLQNFIVGWPRPAEHFVRAEHPCGRDSVRDSVVVPCRAVHPELSPTHLQPALYRMRCTEQ